MKAQYYPPTPPKTHFIEENKYAPNRRNSIFVFYTLLSLLFLEVNDDLGIPRVGNFMVLLAPVLILFFDALERGRPSILLPKLMAHDTVFLIYLLFALCSAIWSSSPFSTVSGVIPIFGLFFLSLLLSQQDELAFVRGFIFLAIGAALLSLVLFFVGPDLSFQPSSSTGAPELRGILQHQLRLGTLMGIAIGFIAIAHLNSELNSPTKNKFLSLIMLSLFLLTLYLSRARLYGLVSFLSLFLTIGLFYNKLSRNIIFAFIVIFGSIFYLYFDSIMIVLENYGIDTSLTGRTLIWERVIGAISDAKMWFGFGYGVLNDPAYDRIFPGLYRPPHAHNSFIQAWFETGLFGLLLLVTAISAQFSALWATAAQQPRYSYAVFLFFFNVFGSLFGLNYAGSLSVLFSLSIIMLAIETRLPNQRPR